MLTLAATMALATLQVPQTAIPADPFGFRRPAPPSERALYGDWRSCVLGGGGYGQGVAFTREPGTLYLAVDVGGLYRSEDGGRRWRMLHGALPQDGLHGVRSLSPDPRDADRLLLLRGDQWTDPEAKGPDGRGGAGIYETRDGGRSFTKLRGLPVYASGPDRWTGTLLRRDPKEPGRIYAGTAGDGVYVSEDDAKTWRRVGPTGVYATDIVVDKDDPQTVWLLGRAQEVDTYAGRKLFEGGIYRSDDRGRTWARLARSGPSEMVQVPGALRPGGPVRLLGIFDETDVRVSDDGGTTWRAYTDGIELSKTPEREPVASEKRFSALAEGPGFTLLGTNRGTFYRRATNGASWERVEPKTAVQNVEGRPWALADGAVRGRRFGAAMSSVTIDPRDARHWWITDLYGVYETRDDGENWRLAVDGVEETVVTAIEGDPRTPAVVHIGIAGEGLLTSRDGGTRFESPSALSTAKSIAVSYQSPDRLLVAGDAGNGESASDTLWLSVDRGQSLARLPMTGLPPRGLHRINTVAFDPRDDRRVYAAVSGPQGGMYVSADGGLTWLRQSDGLPTEDAALRPGEERGAALFGREIWGVGREFAVNGDGEVVVTSRPRGEVYRLDGERYVKVTGVTGPPNEIAGAPDRRGVFLVASETGIFRSEDGGRTFTQTLRANASHVAIDKTNPRRCAAGIAGGVMLSTDGGLTWRETGGGLPGGGLPDRNGPVVGFASGRLLAGTAGSGAFWLPLDLVAYRVEPVRPVAERKPVLPEATPGRGRGLALLPQEASGLRFGSVWSVTSVERGRLSVDGTNDPFGGSRSGAGSGAGSGVGVRDSATLGASGGGALRLRALTDGARGTASARLVSPPARFRVRGLARVQGPAPKETLVLVRGYDALRRPTASVTLFDARSASSPTPFEADVELPPGTVEADLALSYEGSGSALLSDVRFESPADDLTPAGVPLPTDLLENGGFEDPARAVEEWRSVLQKVGKLSVGVTSETPHGGTRALLVRNVPGLAATPGASDEAEGAVTARLKRVVRRLRIEGYARSEGTLREATLFVRSFDTRGELRLVPVADARGSRGWTPFVAEVEMPDGTTGIELVLTFAGVGSVSLDDLRVTTLVER